MDDVLIEPFIFKFILDSVQYQNIDKYLFTVGGQ